MRNTDSPTTIYLKKDENNGVGFHSFGYSRSVTQIVNKLKQLKIKYKQDSNRRSGRALMEWDYSKEVNNQVLAKSRWFIPEVTKNPGCTVPRMI